MKLVPANRLREYTAARVALNRAGSSIATQDVLDFQLAHAQARDAVHAALDVGALAEELRQRGLSSVSLQSAARTRREYLRHPERGRTLTAEAVNRIPAQACDLVFVIADGLSALAASRHAIPLLDEVFQLIPDEFTIGPVFILEQGRVAVGDVIGAALGAKICVVLIGERPGLSSPDSLGAYITWEPRVGRNDAERNCISNIRPEGLGYAAAARALSFYLHESLRRKLSGTALKLTKALPAP